MAYRTESEGKFYIYKDGQTESPEFPWRGYANMFDDRIAQNKPIGVGGYVQTKGKVRPWYRWIRRTIPQFNGYYVTYVPDPNDNPPAVLELAVLSVANCNSVSEWNESNYTYGPNRKPNTEYISIDIVGETGSGHDSGGSTAANFRVDKIIPVAAGGAMEISPEGYEVVHGPWLDVDVKVGLLGNRYVGSDSGSVALGGLTSLQVSFVTEAQNYYAASPDPYALALVPCPDPTPQAPLNQYVMTGGGGIFTVPTTVSYTGSSSRFYYRLVHGLDWTIARAPSPMLPRVSNGSTTFSGNSTSLFPQHLPSGSSSAIPGLAFDDLMPFNNSDFGTNSITHSFEGTPFATSNFAIFFDWQAANHPVNGPTMVSGLPSGVPNYVYYYDQAWKNPFGTEVRFWHSNGSQYSHGNSYVQIGWDAHGLSGVVGPHTYLFAKEPSSGRLVFVGYQVIRGLDNYARIIYHECVHKRLYEAISAGAIDADPDSAGVPIGDGLPDSIETQIGTSTATDNSVPWNSAYGDYSDQETFCRMCERDLPVPDDDWASDGFNFSRPSPPNRCERVREYIDPAYNKASLTWVNARTLVP